MIFGIDYGSKLAGTTVICYDDSDKLHFISSEKKQDADRMIIESVKTHEPEAIGLDAPLSLPRAYFTGEGSFFYREADIELKAMSPMFLGGLTARAMSLKHSLGSDSNIFEIYPAALVKSLELSENYRKKEKEMIQPFIGDLNHFLPLSLAHPPTTWHQVDSVLAWLSAYRKENGHAAFLGKEEEGGIWV